MTIELTAEDEKLIHKRLQSGIFRSPEEVIHDALASQDAETQWLAENKDALNEKIAHGLAQLDAARGFREKRPVLGSRNVRPPGSVIARNR